MSAARSSQGACAWGLALALALAWPALGWAEGPSVWAGKVEGTPDVLQTDAEGGFTRGGMFYCAPAALADGLLWLAGQGYPALSPQTGDPEEDGRALVRRLVEPRYLDTDKGWGSSTEDVLGGLERYLRDHGAQDFALLYQGWQEHAQAHSAGRELPDLAWVRQHATDPKTAVWLNLGWYVHDPQTDVWRRFGGHWVSVVGYGVTRDGKHDPNVVLVRDPSPRTGEAPRVEHVRLAPLRAGTLAGRYPRLPRAAKGLLKAQDGLLVRPGATAGLLDGVVVLKLR